MRYILLSMLLLSAGNMYASTAGTQQNPVTDISRATEATVKILLEQPDSIEAWQSDRVYLVPGRIVVSRDGIFVCAQRSHVKIPSFAIDEEGVFILCSPEEAQAHYDRAWGAFREVLGQTAGSGTGNVDNLPIVGVYEGYRGGNNRESSQDSIDGSTLAGLSDGVDDS
jgi:hypothetical protein